MSTQEEFEAKLDSMTVSTIVGEPTMKSYENLINELKPIAIKLKTSLFPKGQKYGFLATITTEDDYASIIDDTTYRWTEPEEPEDYDSTITDEMTDTQRKQREEQHKRYKVEYNKYIAATNVLRARIVDAIEEEYIEKIRDPVVDYDEHSPYLLLEQIKSVISLTTHERNEIKNLVKIPWDGTSTLRKFSIDLDANRKTAKRWKITILETDVMDHFVEQIYKSNAFDEKVMMAWENKRAIFKTWEHCKAYFLKEADDKSAYNKSTAKQMGYHSAANVEDAEDMEDNVNIVLEAMQKSAEEINAVVATNTGLEATIKGLERTISEQSKQISKLIGMNENLVKALATAGKEVQDKDKADKAKAEAEKKTGGATRLCPYCKKKHWGAGKRCVARKCNAHLRPDNWKGEEVDE
jgi:hypothetical protein